MQDWYRLLSLLRSISAPVSDRLLQDFSQIRIAEQKDDGSLVTASDRWADEQLQQALQAAFPDWGVLSEESAHTLPEREWSWVVDPLDGTTNFAKGIPIWSISLGLLHRGTPVFGYVTVPPLRQEIYGWLGEVPAAFCGERALRVSAIAPDPKTRKNSFFSSCSRSLEAMGTATFPFKLRMLGVASYNLLTVALGSTIGAVEATPKIWDIAAAYPIILAAGGLWLPLETHTDIFPLTSGCDYGDRSFPTLAVSHSELVPLLRSLTAPLNSPKQVT